MKPAFLSRWIVAPVLTAASVQAACSGGLDPNRDDEDKALIVATYREMYRAMLARRTDQLGPLLDDGYSLTHITGYRQTKREWLSAIDAGEMLYHAAREVSVSVELRGDIAVLVGRSEVTATIYGGRGAWNLQLTTTYARRGGTWIAMDTVATTYGPA